MTKYSKTAIALHWIIAILVVTNVTLASVSEDLPRAARAAYMNPHKAIGVSILLLSLFRLFWRLGNKPPPMPDAVTGWQAKLGKTCARAVLFPNYRRPVDRMAYGCGPPGGTPARFLWAFQPRSACRK